MCGSPLPAVLVLFKREAMSAFPVGEDGAVPVREARGHADRLVGHGMDHERGSPDHWPGSPGPVGRECDLLFLHQGRDSPQDRREKLSGGPTDAFTAECLGFLQCKATG